MSDGFSPTDPASANPPASTNGAESHTNGASAATALKEKTAVVAPAPATKAQEAAPGGAGGGARAYEPFPDITDRGGFAPTLLSTSVFFISLAVGITVTLYVLWPFPSPTSALPADAPWWVAWQPMLVSAAGTLIAAVAACLFAAFHKDFTCPDRVDPEVYGELRSRLETFDAILPVLCPGRTKPAICEQETPIACRASCNEAWARRDFIARELRSKGGARWVLGTGYVDLYRQLHAANAALFLVQSSAEVVANGQYDNLRLDGATAMPNWKALQESVRNALPLVGGPKVRLLTGTPADAAGAPPADTTPTPAEQAMGRAILRDIRDVISDFRDGERANLVRARNKLAWTGTITAIAAYALLVLAILGRAAELAVITGVGYFVVGGAVGLFNQLRNDWNRGTFDDDFGFHRARLFYTPVLSGLAAVGGVVVVTLLMEAANFGAADDTAPALWEVFDILAYPQGVVIAAVFGLTPDLLVDRLANKANEYRAGLSSTTAVSSGTPAEGG